MTEAWTGPQVAWKMARGYDGAFGGKKINSALGLARASARVFLLGLADLRRPLSLRNLDLLVLLSFSVSLLVLQQRRHLHERAARVPAAASTCSARMAWIGGTAARHGVRRPVWPVWVLAAATVFLAGFRIGLNVADVERDRRRLRGRDRRAPDRPRRGAVRALPGARTT